MHDPIAQFSAWLDEARATAAIREPTAMTLATAAKDGAPSARMVLLKGAGPEGFVFYSNTRSRKGHELAENPQAALCFYWMPLDRQVRIEGKAVPVDATEADRYFASRERGSQISAWASLQSETLDDPATLQARVKELEAQYRDAVPRPPHWSGWRLIPQRIEFWSQGEARLHRRDLYTRDGDGWAHTHLYP